MNIICDYDTDLMIDYDLTLWHYSKLQLVINQKPKHLPIQITVQLNLIDLYLLISVLSTAVTVSMYIQYHLQRIPRDFSSITLDARALTQVRHCVYPVAVRSTFSPVKWWMVL